MTQNFGTNEIGIKALLTRLRGVKGEGGQYSARCPAHDDRSASLSVGTGQDGRILLHCHAGCAPEAVAGALGLTLGELSPRREASPWDYEAVYSYTGADGKVVAQKLRRPGKRFAWRRPDGNGGWIYDRKGVATPLYNLPSVAMADAVWVVEGEKDADTLIGQGFAATCNPDGAGRGKWQPQYTDALVGKDIVIIPDNDELGKAHAREIAGA